MSDLIEIKLSAEIGQDSIAKMKAQLEQLGKTDGKIKPEIDTTDINKKLKEIEKTTGKPMELKVDTSKAESAMKGMESTAGQLRTTTLKTFTDGEGAVSGFAVTMQDAGKQLKEVETFAKNADGEFKSLGKTMTNNVEKPIIDVGKALKDNLKLDNTTKEMSEKLKALGEDFKGLVKPEDISKVKDMMKALDPSDINFSGKVKEINTEIKNIGIEAKKAQQPIIDMGNALTDNLKLDNTVRETSQKLEVMSKEFGDLVKPEDIARVQSMMKALDPSDKIYPQKVREMNIELKRMREIAKGVLQDQAYMAKQHSDALKMNKQMNKQIDKQMAEARAPKIITPEKFAGDAQRAGRSLIAMAAPILAVGAASVKASITFESSFAGVRKTVEATEEQFATLAQGMRDMSKVMPQSSSAIAEVGEIAGQLGIAQADILDFTEVMIKLGDTTNLSSETAAAQLAKFANVTKMDHSNFERLGSTIVDLGNKFATTEQDIVQLGMRLAGSGHQVGLSEAEIMGLSTALSSVGLQAEMGGSAFSKVMTDMNLAVSSGVDRVSQLEKATGLARRELELMSSNDPKGFRDLAQGLGSTTKEITKTIKAGRDLEHFSKIAGMTSKEFEKAFKKDAVGAIGLFIEGLGSAEDKGEDAIQMLEDLGVSSVRIRDTLLRAGGAKELFARAIDVGNAAWEENIALTTEAEERYKTSESQLLMLKNRVVDAGIEIGGSLAPALVKLVDGAVRLVEAFSKIPTSIQTTIIAVAGITTVFGGMLSIFGRMGRGGTEIFGFFKTLSGVMKGTSVIAETTGSSIGATSGIIKLLTGTTGLYVAGVAAAIGLAAFAITSHLDKVKKEKEAVDKLIADLPEIRLKQNDDVKYMEETAKEFERLNKLVGENGDLSGLSAKQKERYLEITKKLSEMSPEMESFYNSEGELIAGNTTKMKELIEAKEDEMRITALKAQAGIGGKLDDHEKAVSKVDKEIKKIDKQIKQEEKLKETQEEKIEYYESIGAHEDFIDDKKKEILKTEENIYDLELKKRDVGLEVVKNIEELYPAIKGALHLMGEELDNITPKTEIFEQSFKNMLKDDPQNGAENVKKSLRELGIVFEDLNKKVANGGKITSDDMQLYVRTLEDAGMSSKDATQNILETVAVIESGEGKVELLSKAFNEFSTEGKISANTAKELATSFASVPKGVEKVDVALIRSVAESDQWAAALLASQMQVSNGYSDMFTEMYGKKSEELKLDLGDLTSSDNVFKKIGAAKKAKDEVLEILRKEVQEKKSITQVAYSELGILTKAQYDEENRITQEKSDQQVEDVKLKYREIEIATVEAGTRTAKALELAMGETENVMRVFNEFEPELKEFIIEQIGVDETHQDFEKLFTAWLQNPEVKEFITTSNGMQFILDNIDELDIAWHELTPEEQEFHAKAVGTLLEDIDGFEKKWNSLDPKVMQYIAEAAGIENVETANTETMALWAEDPKVKFYVASQDGLENIVIKLNETTGEWEIPVGVKTFNSKEDGMDTIMTKMRNSIRDWNLAGNPSKTFTTTLEQVYKGMPKNNAVTKGVMPMGTKKGKWMGDKNFEGGLTYVGERGKELLVYPDDSYGMTGETTELRNLPKGTRIYNNRDTEDILVGKKIPKFATGNAKPKPNPQPSPKPSPKPPGGSSKEEYRAVADAYAKINSELDRNNVLLQLNRAYQEQAGDDTAKKISLMNEEIKYNKERQKLLSRNNTQLRDEAKLLQKDLVGIFNFKGSWNDNSMTITNMDAIAGKSEVIDEKFKRIVEIMGELPKASQSWLDLNNEIQKVNESIKQILAQEVIDRIAHSKDWIEKRKFYDDWGADNEISSLERVRKYIKEYYAQGIIDYKEYSDQMLEMDKAVASFREAREQERNSALDNAQEKVVAIIRKRGEVEKKALQDSYDTEVLSLKDKETAIKKSYSDELESFRKMVQGKIDALDDQYDEEDYLEQLNKERKEATKIQKQIDVLSLDTSLTARNKVIDLRKQLADQNEKIAKMQQNKERELLKESLQGQLKDKEEDAKNKEEITTKYYELENEKLTKAYESEQQDLEDMYLDAKVYAEAEKALRDGKVQDIKGNFVDITVAFNAFEDEFGKGMGILGDVIKTDFIDQLKLAKLAIEDLNRIERGANYGKGAIGGNNEANNTKLREDKAYLASEIARTEEVISDRKFDGMDVKDQEAYLKRLLTGDYKRSPDYGKGTNSTAQASKDNTARLKEDRAYLDSEIKRTNQVISDRKGAGMSVKDQESYLKRLTSGSYDNGGKITNTGLTLNDFHGTEQNPEWIFNDEQLKKLLTKATQSAVNFAIPKIPSMSSLGNAGGNTYDIKFDIKGNMDRSIFPEVQKMITSTIEKTQAQKISKYKDVGIKRPIY